MKSALNNALACRRKNGLEFDYVQCAQSRRCRGVEHCRKKFGIFKIFGANIFIILSVLKTTENQNVIIKKGGFSFELLPFELWYILTIVRLKYCSFDVISCSLNQHISCGGVFFDLRISSILHFWPPCPWFSSCFLAAVGLLNHRSVAP